MASKNHHVVSNPNGGWSVRRAGTAKAAKTFGTQQEAISHARKIAQSDHGELFIHGRNGQIRERNSYGSDSYPPKG
jgi:hypothetical protein